MSKDPAAQTWTVHGFFPDTGSVNLLATYSFDGNNVFQKRYYLKRRVYRGSRCWVKIHGRFSRGTYEENEIDVVSIERLSEIEKKIEVAKSYCSKWVANNRVLYDLNNYKNTKRFKQALNDLKDLDFNKTDFRASSNVVFLDFEKMIVGIQCGQHKLRETAHRLDLLVYTAIYDLSAGELIEVTIDNAGHIYE